MEFVAATFLGLAGGLHCIGMCGPIALSVGKSYEYLVGRMLSYSALGAIAGAGGSLIALGAYGQTISIVSGVVMMALACIQIWSHWSPLPSGMAYRLTKPVRTLLKTIMTTRTRPGRLAIGILNGLLPCGLVFSALFGAVGTLSAFSGAIFMVCFWAGTVPVIATMAFGGSWIKARVTSRYRIVLPIIGLMVGSLIMVRGMGLGIPFLSPKPPSIITEQGCCGTVTVSHSHSAPAE